MSSSEQNASNIPYRQIRAVYDDETITVYQAYSEAIAAAAVREQKLSASPDFSFDRYTWIKPSWCWMMYRSGYALKDSRQTRILAIKISHENFRRILMSSVVCRGGIPFTNEEKKLPVRVQWDPERSPRLGMLGYRSIQIGVGRAMIEEFVNDMVVGIEDVTARAKDMRDLLGENPIEEEKDLRNKSEKKDFRLEDLVRVRVMPNEVEYVVDEELRAHLNMDGGNDS